MGLNLAKNQWPSLRSKQTKIVLRTGKYKYGPAKRRLKDLEGMRIKSKKIKGAINIPFNGGFLVFYDEQKYKRTAFDIEALLLTFLKFEKGITVFYWSEVKLTPRQEATLLSFFNEPFEEELFILFGRFAFYANRFLFKCSEPITFTCAQRKKQCNSCSANTHICVYQQRLLCNRKLHPKTRNEKGRSTKNGHG